jgi:hypothetical protein
MAAKDALDSMQEKNARNVLVSSKGEVVGIVAKLIFSLKSRSRVEVLLRLRLGRLCQAPSWQSGHNQLSEKHSL